MEFTLIIVMAVCITLLFGVPLITWAIADSLSG